MFFSLLRLEVLGCCCLGEEATDELGEDVSNCLLGDEGGILEVRDSTDRMCGGDDGGLADGRTNEGTDNAFGSKSDEEDEVVVVVQSLEADFLP